MEKTLIIFKPDAVQRMLVGREMLKARTGENT